MSSPTSERIREAAWIARCVGRGEWAPLSDADLEDLSEKLGVRSFSPSEALFRQGERPDAVWVIRQGRVELAASRRLGRRLILDLLHEGDVDGDIALILGMPPPYTARAVDDVIALRISAGDFEDLLASRLAIARRWLTSVAGRIAHSQQRILQLGSRDLPAQAASLLLDEAEDGVVELPQESLAALLGVHRQSLNAVLRAMEQDDLVRLSYRRIELLDADALNRRAKRSPSPVSR